MFTKGNKHWFLSWSWFVALKPVILSPFWIQFTISKPIHSNINEVTYAVQFNRCQPTKSNMCPNTRSDLEFAQSSFNFWKVGETMKWPLEFEIQVLMGVHVSSRLWVFYAWTSPRPVPITNPNCNQVQEIFLTWEGEMWRARFLDRTFVFLGGCAGKAKYQCFSRYSWRQFSVSQC